MKPNIPHILGFKMSCLWKKTNLTEVQKCTEVVTLSKNGYKLNPAYSVPGKSLNWACLVRYRSISQCTRSTSIELSQVFQLLFDLYKVSWSQFNETYYNWDICIKTDKILISGYTSKFLNLIERDQIYIKIVQNRLKKSQNILNFSIYFDSFDLLIDSLIFY